MHTSDADIADSILSSVVHDAIVAQDGNHIITHWNKQAEEMFGWSAEEAVGKPSADILRAAAPGVPGEGEAVYRHRDGREIHAHARSGALGNAGTVFSFRDITDLRKAEAKMRADIAEREKAEEARRKSEEQLHALVSSMLDEVWFSDTGGTVTMVNPSVLREFGEFPSGKSIEHIHSNLQVFYPDGNPRPPEEAPLLKALNGEAARHLEEIIRTPAKGELRFRQVNAAPVKDIRGSVIGSVAVVRDITEQKRTESALVNERKRFLDMLETLPVMVCLLTSDERVVFANRAFREKFGDPDGRRCYEYCWGFSQPCSFCEAFIPLKTGQPHHWEFVHPNGDVHIDAYDFPFVDSDGSALILEMDIDITERRKAEKALKRSEARYRTLFESMGEGFAVAEMEFDPEGKPVDYTILEANGAYEKQSGLRPEQVLGRRATEFLDSAEPIWFERYGKVVVSGEPQRFEEYSASLDRWFSVHAFPLPAQNHFGMIFGDITERRRFEKALARQGYLLDSVNDAVVATDMDFVITYWNKAAERTYGWTAEEAVGRNADVLLDTVFIGGSLKEAIRRLGQEKSIEVEVVHTRKDGSKIDVTTKVSLVWDDHGQPSGTVGVLRDVTERKRAGEALRRSEERQMFLLKLSDAVRPLGDPIAIEEAASRLTGEHFGATRVVYAEIDRDPGIVVVSREWARPGVPSTVGRYRMDDFGAFASNLLCAGRPVVVEDAASDPRISPEERRHWEQVDMRSFIGLPLMKDGRLVACFTVYHDGPHRWSEGEAELLVEIADRTWASLERARAEEALRESEKKALALVEKLEDADRNKNQFLSVLSHELRNPLAAISAGIPLLDAAQEGAQAAKVREILARQTNHLCRLVDDLLELTRISKNKIRLKRENVDLNAILRGAAEDIGPEYEKKGIKLASDIPPAPIVLSADPVRVAQIMENLLANALKFTPAGGTVRLSLAAEVDCAVITVKDNGMGIDPEMMPHLFTPFIQADNHTLDRSHSGLGLGLSIVKGMVALHGGEVTAFSDGPGRGSTFAVRLPIARAEDWKPEIQAAGGGEKRALKILMIEDNRDFADLMHAMLSAMGHSVCLAYDGMEGVKRAREVRPDVILCDVGLPGMSGYDVAARIRGDAGLRGAYLVALTGYAGEEDVERARKAGFHRHMAKPVHADALRQLLGER